MDTNQKTNRKAHQTTNLKILLWLKGYFFDDTIIFFKFLFKKPILGCIAWIFLGFMALIVNAVTGINSDEVYSIPGTPEATFHLSTTPHLNDVGFPHSMSDYQIIDTLKTENIPFHLRWVSTAIPEVAPPSDMTYATGAVTNVEEELQHFRGMKIISGEIPNEEKPGVIITQALAKKTKWNTGDKISFAFRNPYKDEPIKISTTLSGIIDIDTDWSDAQQEKHLELERIYIPWSFFDLDGLDKPYNEIAFPGLDTKNEETIEKMGEKYGLYFITPYRHQRMERTLFSIFALVPVFLIFKLRDLILRHMKKALHS